MSYLYEEVYDIHTDTAGNWHWIGTGTGHHVLRLKNDELNGRKDRGMSSGMNVEQAKELASKRNYKWAVGNLKGAYGISYKKATRILLYELAEIADRLVFCRECKHRNTPKCAINNDNDFCSYGERIEE